MITQERLKELLEYDPTTGIFMWKITGRKWQGRIAGSLSARYIKISVDKHQYRAHQLAWLYVYGTWPSEVDHKDGDKSNNRIANLRAVSHGTNQQNQFKPQRNSTTGYRGVTYRSSTGRYIAEIRTNGIGKYLGSFSTAEEAHEAYTHAKRKKHPLWIEK